MMTLTGLTFTIIRHSPWQSKVLRVCGKLTLGIKHESVRFNMPEQSRLDGQYSSERSVAYGADVTLGSWPSAQRQSFAKVAP